MKWLPLIALLAATSFGLGAEIQEPKPTVIVAVGAAGEEEFEKEFVASARNWETAATNAGANFISVGITSPRGTNDAAALRQLIASQTTNTSAELWLVFVGHGTWDGKDAKLNLRGPDLSAADLAEALKGLARPVAIVNSASASAPFIKALSTSNRVVITSTRSGAEENYARFGRYLSETIAAPGADLDRDGQTSLLEAFLIASRRVAEFYKSEGRLATEHALLDDNGDGLGTPAEWFRGVRVVKAPAARGAVDGGLAHQWHLVRSEVEQTITNEQRHQRNSIESEISALRTRKAQMQPDAYYAELERLLTQLAPLLEAQQ